MEIAIDRPLLESLRKEGYTVLLPLEPTGEGDNVLLAPQKWNIEEFINSPLAKELEDSELMLIDDLLKYGCDELGSYSVVKRNDG